MYCFGKMLEKAREIGFGEITQWLRRSQLACPVEKTIKFQDNVVTLSKRFTNLYPMSMRCDSFVNTEVEQRVSLSSTINLSLREYAGSSPVIVLSEIDQKKSRRLTHLHPTLYPRRWSHPRRRRWRTMVRKDEIPDGFQEFTVFLEITRRRSVNKTNQKRMWVSQWKL